MYLRSSAGVCRRAFREASARTCASNSALGLPWGPIVLCVCFPHADEPSRRWGNQVCSSLAMTLSTREGQPRLNRALRFYQNDESFVEVVRKIQRSRRRRVRTDERGFELRCESPSPNCSPTLQNSAEPLGYRLGLELRPELRMLTSVPTKICAYLLCPRKRKLHIFTSVPRATRTHEHVRSIFGQHYANNARLPYREATLLTAQAQQI